MRYILSRVVVPAVGFSPNQCTAWHQCRPSGKGGNLYDAYVPLNYSMIKPGYPYKGAPFFPDAGALQFTSSRATFSDRVLLDAILRQGATGLAVLEISNLCFLHPLHS